MATIEELTRRIEQLEAWKKQKTEQQISFPLDPKSVEVLNKHFLSKVGTFEFVNTSGLPFRNILVQQDRRIDVISVYNSLARYSVDVSSNEIIMGQDVVNLRKGSFIDNQQVLLLTTAAIPAPFADAVPYYVVNANADGTVFQLSSTSGGSAINITDTGSGEQFMYLLT